MIERIKRAFPDKMWGYLIPAIVSFLAGCATNFIK